MKTKWNWSVPIGFSEFAEFSELGQLGFSRFYLVNSEKPISTKLTELGELGTEWCLWESVKYCTPAKKHKLPHKHYGPYSEVDHKLDGLTRKEATKLNDECISNAIHELAGKAQETRHKLQFNHKMMKPRLHVGQGINRSDAGHWFQWVS